MAVPSLRVGVLIVVVLAGIAALVTLGGPPLRIGWHRLELRTYVNDGQDIKPGAPVRVAGVDVGRVKSVTVRPGRGAQAVEVVMDISTPYELRIPNDAVAELHTAGVLGETYVDIRVQDATGALLQSGGVLKSEPTISGTEWLKQFAEALAKGCPTQSQGTAPKPASKPAQ